MEALIIKPTPKSLDIKCMPGEINLKGNSILEDPKVFFEPVQNWIDDYLKQPEERTTINLKLEYVDTASIHGIQEILARLRVLKNRGHEIIVNWYYDIDDPELLELGEIMDTRLKMDLNLIKY